MTKFMEMVWELVKRGVAFTVAFAVALYVLGASASAQITNTAAALTNTITTGLSNAFDSGVSILIGAITIGAAIMYVRKGFKGRS